MPVSFFMNENVNVSQKRKIYLLAYLSPLFLMQPLLLGSLAKLRRE
jgi:hypothetical protein